jgi:hypothetical protein
MWTADGTGTAAAAWKALARAAGWTEMVILDLQQPSFYFGHHLAVVSKGSMRYTNKLLVERKAHCTNKVSADDDVMQDLHLDTTESLLPSNTWLQHSVFRRLFVTLSYCQKPCRAKQVRSRKPVPTRCICSLGISIRRSAAPHKWQQQD